MAFSPERFTEGLRSDDPQVRHRTLSFTRPRDCVGDVLRLAVAALEDEGEWLEESYDWAGPTGYQFPVRVSDAATKLLERCGVRALEAVLPVLEAGAGPRTRALVTRVALGHEHDLSDETLDGLIAQLASSDDAARMHRRLTWERLRRAGGAATDERLGGLETTLRDAIERARAAGRSGPFRERTAARELCQDVTWALGHATGSKRAAMILVEQLPGHVEGVGAALRAIGPVLDADGVALLARAIQPSRGDASLCKAAAAYHDPRVAESLTARLEKAPKHHLVTATLLADMGDALEEARPRIAALLSKDGIWPSSVAWKALGGPEGLREAERAAFLAKQKKHLETDGRIHHRLLVELGALASPLTEALLQRLATAERGEVPGLLNVLSHIGEAARPAVPTIIDQLRDPRGVRRALAQLTRLGPVAADARDAVQALLDTTNDERIRTAAREALAAMQ